jgi:hypothetical protein
MSKLEDNQAFARALFGGAPPDPAVTDVTPAAENEAPTVTNVTPPDPDPAAAHQRLIANLLGGEAA